MQHACGVKASPLEPRFLRRQQDERPDIVFLSQKRILQHPLQRLLAGVEVDATLPERNAFLNKGDHRSQDLGLSLVKQT